MLIKDISQENYEVAKDQANRAKAHEREGTVIAVGYTDIQVQPKGSTRVIPCEKHPDAEVGDLCTILWVQKSKKYIISSILRKHKTVKISTSADPGIAFAPPTDLTATGINGGVLVQWNVAVSQIATYELQQNTSAIETGATTIATTNSGEWTVITATPLYFRIRSVFTDFQVSSWTSWVLGTPVSLTESVVDIIATALVEGANINLSYDDGAGTITIEVTGIGSTIQAWDADLDAIAALSTTGFLERTGSNTWELNTLASTDLSDFAEAVDDRVNTLITAGVALKKTYDDTGNSLTLDLDITELTEDTAPEETEDYLVSYDYSATTHKKVLLAKLRASRTGSSDISATPTWSDFALVFGSVPDGFHTSLKDTSDSTVYWITYRASPAPGEWHYVAMGQAAYTAFRAYMAARPNLAVYWPGDDAVSRLAPVHSALSEGRNIVVNGTLETGVTAPWVPGSGAALSASTDAPYDGSYSLRVTRTGTNYWAALPSAILIVGALYHITGAYRGDGTSNPYVAYAASGLTVPNGTGTTSTGWQAFDCYAYADSAAGFLLRGNGGANGNWIEFDNISITQMFIPASSDFPTLELLKDTGLDYLTAAWSGANWASGVHTPGSTSPLRQAAPILIGRTYDCIVEVADYVAGSVTPQAGSSGTGGSAISANGVAATQTLTCAGSANFDLVPTSDFDGRIVSVSLVPNDGLIVLDEGIEAWTDATTPTNYGKFVSGTSSVNQETTDVHGGTYACRLDVDASGSLVLVSQASLKTGSTYLVEVWLKASAAGATAQLANGSGTGYTNATFTLTTTWTKYSAVIVASTTTLQIKRLVATGMSIYIDDIHAIEISPLTGVVSGSTLAQSSGNALADPVMLQDGLTDGTIMFASAVNGIFNPLEGELKVYVQHISGTTQYFATVVADTNNGVALWVTAGGLIQGYYEGSATTAIVQYALTDGINHLIALRWNVGADTLDLIVDGVVVATDTGLGVWVGNLAVVVIGAGSSAYILSFNGYIGHIILTNSVDSDAEELVQAMLLGVVS